VAPTKSTFLTVWAAGEKRPGVSNLNAPPGATVANSTVTWMGPEHKYQVFNYAGLTDVVMDVSGSFEFHTAAGAAQAPRSDPGMSSPGLAPDAGATYATPKAVVRR
jgi:hypothetical protein